MHNRKSWKISLVFRDFFKIPETDRNKGLEEGTIEKNERCDIINLTGL